MIKNKIKKIIKKGAIQKGCKKVEHRILYPTRKLNYIFHHSK